MIEKLIIKDSNHLERSIKILEMLDYNISPVKENPYAAIINKTEGTVGWITSPTYQKGDLIKTRYPKARVIHEVNVKRSNRKGTGNKIARIDDEGNRVVYKSMEELLRLNPEASYPAKIYQVAGRGTKMYGYYWEKIPKLNKTEQLKFNI